MIGAEMCSRFRKKTLLLLDGAQLLSLCSHRIGAGAEEYYLDTPKFSRAKIKRKGGLESLDKIELNNEHPAALGGVEQLKDWPAWPCWVD